MVSNAFLDFFFSEPPAGPLRQLQDLGYFVNRQLPGQDHWDFEPALYNRADFLGLNPHLPVLPLHLVKQIGKQSFVQALICFRIGNGKAVSLSGAPFGGPELAPDLPAHVLELFLEHALGEVRNLGVTQVEIRLPASALFNRFAEVIAALARLGFDKKLTEVNHHLPADALAFVPNLHNSARRRLYKLYRNRFAFAEELPGEAEEVFGFIARCRLQKGYYLSLTLEQLRQAMQQFPNRYFFFSVRQNGKLAAATIGVLSAPGILYNYAPAHDTEYDSFSPVILLTEGLVAWCRQHGLHTLDLGTSTLHHEPNQPLITFKKRLGGIASEKVTLVKQTG